MEITHSNPLNLTKSNLAQVEAYQLIIKQIFRKQFKQLQHQPNFYTNQIMVAKFAIARQFDKQKTIQMWTNWVKWYQQYKPNLISQADPMIRKIHQSGKYRYCGKDQNGCPILVIRMRYHIKGLATVQQNGRYLLFMIEKGRKLAQQAKTYQIAVIYDRRDIGQSDDVSSQSMKKFMPILNEYYPQTLRSFYVLGANIFYRAMWKIVSIFISQRTCDKINLLQDPKNLQNFITKQNLDQQYGGTLKIQHVGRFIPLSQQKN